MNVCIKSIKKNWLISNGGGYECLRDVERYDRTTRIVSFVVRSKNAGRLTGSFVRSNIDLARLYKI